MATPEELAEQGRLESEKVAKEAADKQVAEAVKAKELEGIPEALRSKSQRELADLVLESSLQAERERRTREEREAELEQLKPRAQVTEAERKAAKEKEFIGDPTAYLDRHVDERLRPLTEEYFSRQADLTFEFARRDKERYPEFAKYEKDIKSVITKMPVEVRANPQALDWAYKMVEYPELKKKVLESASRAGLHNEGGGAPASVATPKRTLDEEELVVAKRFGLTPEQYIEWESKKGLD